MMAGERIWFTLVCIIAVGLLPIVSSYCFQSYKKKTTGDYDFRCRNRVTDIHGGNLTYCCSIDGSIGFSTNMKGKYCEICESAQQVWSEWGDCSRTCGWGVRTRTRTCERGVCEGPTTEQFECTDWIDCPIIEVDNLQTPKTQEVIGFDTKPQNATVLGGTSKWFVCRPTANTATEWEKDGVAIEASETVELLLSDLLVTDIFEKDEGRYTCYLLDWYGNRVDEADAWLAMIINRNETISDVCGILNSKEYLESINDDDGGFIVGSKTAINGSAPWMARLYHTRARKFFCGASILNYEWIVTAAHCLGDTKEFRVSGNDDIVVWVGDHDGLTMGRDEEKFMVEEIIRHDQFNSGNYDNDIALIKFSRKIRTFTEYVKPVCLPSKALVKEISGPGKLVRVTGWGILVKEGPREYPRFLKELTVPLVAKKVCTAAMNYPVTVNMICASNGTVDACDGDTGGPLVRVTDDRRWQLLGIGSWGEGCGQIDKYGIYTKVSRYQEWITQYVTGVYD